MRGEEEDKRMDLDFSLVIHQSLSNLKENVLIIYKGNFNDHKSSRRLSLPLRKCPCLYQH